MPKYYENSTGHDGLLGGREAIQDVKCLCGSRQERVQAVMALHSTIRPLAGLPPGVGPFVFMEAL